MFNRVFPDEERELEHAAIILCACVYAQACTHARTSIGRVYFLFLPVDGSNEGHLWERKTGNNTG